VLRERHQCRLSDALCRTAPTTRISERCFSRADKENFRSEISFHKKTVAGLTAEKEITMKQSKHDKEVLTQVIQVPKHD
jgi:hypothetical protein